MLLYHGKQLFGKSVDNPSLLAQTVLGIMLIYLYGGPKFLTKLIPISKFLTKLIPISKLTSAFLFDQIELTVKAITSGPVDVKAIMWWLPSKSNLFLNYMLNFLEKPWLTEDNKDLLFDYDHLLKNICNLWLTEKTELIFDDNGVRQVAKWPHLKQLYLFKSEKQNKLSDLNEISIAPKPIERQRVSTCFRVFSEKKIMHFSLSLE